MDIFRLRHRMLCRKLWKSRCRNSALEVDKTAVYTVVSRLTDPQLKTLARVVEQRFNAGSECTTWNADCIPVDVSSLNLCPLAFVVLCCRLWRPGWASRQAVDIDTSRLEPLPLCACRSMSASICCNPYHWTVDVTPPPPTDYIRPAECVYDDNMQQHEYSSNSYTADVAKAPPSQDRDTRCQFKEDTDTEYVESTTSGDGGKRPWCHVAYREFRDTKHILSGVRGGYQGSLAVFTDDLHIFAGLHDGSDGLCLSALRTAARGSHASGRPCESCGRRVTSTISRGRETIVEKTLAKVGHGLVLSRRHTVPDDWPSAVDGRSVWLYNCSEFPVFVDSRSLRGASAASGSGSGRVCKVLPGQSVCVYDRRLVNHVRTATAAATAAGTFKDGWSATVDSTTRCDSVLVSFVKGWSGQYKRQTILSCPCWLEILVDECSLAS